MRILDIIKSEFTSEKLKLEEEIERTINNKSLETNDKVTTLKKLLREVVLTELSFVKFKDLTSKDETKN